MKIMVMPKSKEELLSVMDYSDAFILGLKDLSINMPNYFTMDEIKEIISLTDAEIFVSLNKNMHNDDLEALKEAMFELDKLNIAGIMYYDIAVVNLKIENNLKTPLVWGQEHMTTNYITSNYWFDFGASYTLLSSEITIEEVNEIKNNAKASLILTVFGYLPMFVSKRHLVKNYLKTFNLTDDSKINYIEKLDNKYPIIDDESGTIAYSSHILNGIGEIPNLHVDYVLLNSFNIDSIVFKEVVEMASLVTNDNALEYTDKIDQMLNTDRGFLYKETIYKVKK